MLRPMVLLLSTTALSSTLGYGTVHCRGNPPLRYQHDATARVHYVSKKKLAAECGKGNAACESNGEMWVRNPCNAPDVNDLDSLDSDTCHELGHVNGWPGDHPL